jgi:Ca2+-binding EF-hand superfamily protein
MSRDSFSLERGADFQSGVSAQTLGEVHARLQRPCARSPPPSDAKTFKQALWKKFGKLEYAWEEIDSNNDGALQFHEFVRACRDMQFSGNLRKIFDDVTGGKDAIKPEMLDPNLPARLKALGRSRASSLSREPGADFHGGVSAQTLGEVHMMLQRPSSRSPPPSTARAFKQALLKKFGKLDRAWEEIDLNGDNALQFNEFVRACRGMHFQGNLRQIFDELAGGSDVLTSEKLSPDLPARLEKRSASRELESLSLSRDSSRRNSGSNFEVGSSQTLGEVHLKLQRSFSLSPPPSSAKAFRLALKKKFGKFEYAWQEIDSNNDGALQFNEFVRACRNMQFSGNLRRIFDELTGGDDILRPEQLEPGLETRLESMAKSKPRTPSLSAERGSDFQGGASCQTLGEVHAMLQRPDARAPPPSNAKEFKQALIKKFGKLEYAWDEIDSNDDGSLQFNEFVRACRNMQFSGNFRKIFDDLTGGKDALSPEALDASLPARLQRSRMSSISRELSLCDTTRSDFQAGYSAQTLGEVHTMLQRPCSRSPPPNNAKAFKQALLKKFGKLEYAWQEIDANGDGAIQFNEFVRACRHMQFSGNMRKIFDELTGGADALSPDALESGLTERLGKHRQREESRCRSSSREPGAEFQKGSAQTLGEVHLKLQRPEAKAPPPCSAKDFRAALLKKYGNLDCAWKNIDGNSDGALQFNEFVRSCRSMDFGGNLKKIFNEIAPSGELLPCDLSPDLAKQVKRQRKTPKICNLSSSQSVESSSTAASSSASPETSTPEPNVQTDN